MTVLEQEPVTNPALNTLRVFPVKNKRPLVKGWQDSGPISLDAITHWESKYPGCSWGAALDADTLVIDGDNDQAASALSDLGELPTTLTTLTPRGFHFWFRMPETTPVRNRVGILPGVDVRTRGGYVVVPPSDGYGFADVSTPIADAPDWLLDLVTGDGALTPSTPPVLEGESLVTLKMGSGFVLMERETGLIVSEWDGNSLPDRKPPQPVRDLPEPVNEKSTLTPYEQDLAKRGWERRIGPAAVPEGRSPFSLRILLEPRTVVEGTRNTALFAYLCRLRRDGKAEEFIRSEAFRVMARIPAPMGKFEVERIIANALKYDAGAMGGNTLAEAWRTVEQMEVSASATKFYRFLLLVEQLAELRPESKPTILLPVRSIGTLMGVYFTQVAKWRRKAEEMGILSKTSRYVRRRLADEFAVKPGFSPLADGPAAYKVKRGRKPKKRVEAAQAA